MFPLADYDVIGCQEQPGPDHAVSCGAPLPATPQACAKIRTGRKRASRGNALIEFTLVMPILLAVSTGMVSFGFALQNQLALTNAVSLGAQAVAFSRGQTSDPCATGYTAITNAAPALTSGLSLTFVINGTTYSGVTSCAAGASNMVQGATVEITGAYPVTLAVFSQSFAPGYLVAKTSEYIQ